MASVPLLYDELTLPEQITLGSMVNHPGYPVLVKLMNAVCARATGDVIKLDPADKDYGRKIKDLHQKARMMSEFCASVLKSVDYHTAAATQKQAEEEGADEVESANPLRALMKSIERESNAGTKS